MMYKHIFFDLDHTLWDYEQNSEESLRELYALHGLADFDLFSEMAFLEKFTKVNYQLWHQYNEGQIEREDIRQFRFRRVLQQLGLEDEALATRLSADYLDLCPNKNKLLPYALETLAYLGERYELSIITNGFTEIQVKKLKGSKIDHYFKSVTTSDGANSRKPSKAIFDFAIEQAKSKPSESLMVGDNLEADVAGAMGAAIDAVYFNPKATPHQAPVTYEVSCLSTLMNML